MEPTEDHPFEPYQWDPARCGYVDGHDMMCGYPEGEHWSSGLSEEEIRAAVAKSEPCLTLWPEHWAKPEDLRAVLIERNGFSEEDADGLLESLGQALRGEGRVLYPRPLTKKEEGVDDE